jgi:o-succinylbenzoate synthase
MSLEASYEIHQLAFKFDAGTSRGVLRERSTYLLKIWDSENPSTIGLGEASPLIGLSPEYSIVRKQLTDLCVAIQYYNCPNSEEEIADVLERLVSPTLPSIRFALETALLDLYHGGTQRLFSGKFIEGQQSIPINGLIWMGDVDFMKEQIDQKLVEGYQCIKMKIGALEFEQECHLLEYIRSGFHSDLTLRVDANGAFHGEQVESKLKQLSKYDLHSIEQPMQPGQWEIMKNLCQDPMVPIALDEELIGITEGSHQEELLDYIRPQFIVLKPTLLGGLNATREWIQLAESRGIGWWVTSALESNIGLNALAQFTASLNVDGYQGLGTGQLYKNNFPGNLEIIKGHLYYIPD